jgi:hypothetical protein
MNEQEIAHFYNLLWNYMLGYNKKYKVEPKFKNIDQIKKREIDLGQLSKIISDSLKDQKFLTEFIEKNENNFNQEELEIFQSWECAIEDDFYMLKHLKNVTVLFHGASNLLLGIKSLIDPLELIFPKSFLPTIFSTTILPYKEHLTYVGIFRSPKVTFGGNVTAEMMSTYNASKAKYGIIDTYKKGTKSLLAIDESSDKEELIKYHLKEYFKHKYEDDFYAAQQLAKLNENNNIAFHKELGKYTERYIKKTKKQVANDLPKLYYAAYRDVVVAVATSKAELENICSKNAPGLDLLLHKFSV